MSLRPTSPSPPPSPATQTPSAAQWPRTPIKIHPDAAIEHEFPPVRIDCRSFDISSLLLLKLFFIIRFLLGFFFLVHLLKIRYLVVFIFYPNIFPLSLFFFIFSAIASFIIKESALFFYVSFAAPHYIRFFFSSLSTNFSFYCNFLEMNFFFFLVRQIQRMKKEVVPLEWQEVCLASSPVIHWLHGHPEVMPIECQGLTFSSKNKNRHHHLQISINVKFRQRSSPSVTCLFTQPCVR